MASPSSDHTLTCLVIRAIVRLARTDEDNNNNCLQQILLAIVQCAEDLAKYFNVYAFSRVAIYGKSFTTSGRETWDMFRAKGIDMVINDDLTGHVMHGTCAVFDPLTLIVCRFSHWGHYSGSVLAHAVLQSSLCSSWTILMMVPAGCTWA